MNLQKRSTKSKQSLRILTTSCFRLLLRLLKYENNEVSFGKPLSEGCKSSWSKMYIGTVDLVHLSLWNLKSRPGFWISASIYRKYIAVL